MENTFVRDGFQIAFPSGDIVRWRVACVVGWAMLHIRT